jgi:hypothetical protein
VYVPEAAYYNKKLGDLCCFNCGETIDNSKTNSEIQNLKTAYGTVKPSCGNGCPEHLTSRKKITVSSKSARIGKRKAHKRAISRRARKRQRLAGTLSAPVFHGLQLLGAVNFNTWMRAMEDYWGKL